MQDHTLSDFLADMRPRKIFSRRWTQRSAVALVLDDDAIEQAQLLLIKRADKEGDPWSGHMAFPGGRQERVDKNGLATAKREMLEEVGFDIDRQGLAGKPIGRLSDVKTTRRVIPKPMVISPYVFLVDEQPPLTPNHEVAETLWVPMAYFAELENRSVMSVDYRGQSFSMPCYRYDKKVIWGLTLSIIDELLSTVGVQPPEWTSR